MEEYFKDFDRWNEVKKKLDQQRSERFFREGELWWCSIGVNVGHEEAGKGTSFLRPVVIFKILGRKIFWGIPVTTKTKVKTFHVAISIEDSVGRLANILQMRSLDCRRLVERIGTIGKGDYFFIGKAVTDISVVTAFQSDLPP